MLRWGDGETQVGNPVHSPTCHGDTHCERLAVLKTVKRVKACAGSNPVISAVSCAL